ncbi:MAG TPA: hypothetical protein VK866_16880 [Acidimicrobiales bacterium]|nr:hypothetical protein [Acidimicrobiales bacterium]
MAFEIVITGSPGRTVRALIEDLVGERAVRDDGGATVVVAEDQAALIGVLTHLHDLGLTVDEVRAASSTGPPAAGTSPAGEER